MQRCLGIYYHVESCIHKQDQKFLRDEKNNHLQFKLSSIIFSNHILPYNLFKFYSKNYTVLLLIYLISLYSVYIS